MEMQEWSISTIKQHYDSILSDMQASNDRRFAASEKAVDVALLAAEKAVTTAFASQKEAVAQALVNQKEAVGVAERNAEKWRDNANEWRSAMNDREKNFMQRAEFLAYKESTEKAILMEKERNDKREGKSAGYAQFVGWIVAGLTVIGFVLANFIRK